MYCPFCGEEIRNGAIYCSQCGKDLVSGKKNPAAQVGSHNSVNKKLIVAAICIGVAIVLTAILVTILGPKSLVGTWVDQNGTEISFSSNGKFEWGSGYGTYTLYDDKKLSFIFNDFDHLGDNYSYYYGEEAKIDSHYWFISGNTLYLKGKTFTKK